MGAGADCFLMQSGSDEVAGGAMEDFDGFSWDLLCGFSDHLVEGFFESAHELFRLCEGTSAGGAGAGGAAEAVGGGFDGHLFELEEVDVPDVEGLAIS